MCATAQISWFDRVCMKLFLVYKLFYFAFCKLLSNFDCNMLILYKCYSVTMIFYKTLNVFLLF